MLVAPLWVLAFVGDKVKRLWVITLFVVLFLPLVVFTSSVKSSEASLAATAAYVLYTCGDGTRLQFTSC